MDIGTFLLRKQWIKQQEYAHVLWRAIKAGEGKFNGESYLEPALQDASEPEDIARFRPFPFGDVLEREKVVLDEVLRRAGLETFDELIGTWQNWHVDQMQPISDFRLGPVRERSFGRRLYESEFEKRKVARFVAERIVHNADHVILPEGTSTFWAGLAVLCSRRNLTIITSNGALVRELHENPKLRERTQTVTIAGGDLDVDEALGGSASRGFVGDHATLGFNKCFIDPGATVLISSVNGILPDRGPFAPQCDDVKRTRYKLIRNALKSNIRRIVFIFDHTKMRRSKEPEYGDPIFSRQDEWRRIITEHRDRIALVTVPPAEFFDKPELVRASPMERPIVGTGYSRPLLEYLAVAAEFCRACDSGSTTGLLEVGISERTPATTGAT